MKNNILAVFMLLCIAFPLSAQYSAGAGTEAAPYQISSIDDLNDLSLSPTDWGKHFILTEDIDASETHNYTNASGDTVGFTPIGSSAKGDLNFFGTFDGQGFTISNLYINLPNDNYVGLFGYLGTHLNNALVKNLNMVNASIVGNNYVGVLSGYTDYSEVYDCSIDGDVVGDSYVGIAAGESRTVFNKVSTSGTVTGNDYVGGFVGSGSHTLDIEFYFYACSSSTNVVGKSYVGGFTGMLTPGASYCYSNGSVDGEEYVGGFAGLIDASLYTIDGCFATGDVIATSNSIGGFAGQISGAYELSQCFANNVISTTDTATIIGGFSGNYILSLTNLENNIYNSEISNTSSDDPEGVIGINTSAFSTSSTYDSWEFDANWEIIQNDEFSVTSLPIPKVHLYDYQILFESAITEAGSVSVENVWLNEGESIVASCTTPVDHYLFRGWYIGEERITADLNLTTTATEDATYTALYYVPYSGGEGTESSPYELSNIADFILLGETTSDYDKYFILTNDIDFSASRNMTNTDGDTVGFTPIGIIEQEFAGHLDGKGYSINNLYINLPITSKVGLFGSTAYAEFSNLSIKDCYVIGYTTAGSLVGDAFYTNVYNCDFEGYIEAYEIAGGMCGLFRGVSLAEKCHSSANVNSTTNAAGGLVANLGAELLQCSSDATVLGSRYVGGLVGTNSGKIQYCSSTGDVTGRYCVGGAMGASNGYSRTSFSSASVTQLPIGNSGDDYGYVGGYIGMQSYAYVYNCYAFGPVDADANQGGFYGGVDPSTSSIAPYDCYFDKETTGQRERYRDGVTALKTAEFADSTEFEVWDFEKVWKIGTIEALSPDPRPYTFPSLGLDCYVTTISNEELHGTVDTLSNFGWYTVGDVVTINATPNEGYLFEGWYVDDVKVTSEAEYNVEVESSINLTAHFSRIPYSFAGGKGSISDPFQIANYDQLKLLSIHIDILFGRNFILTNDIDASKSALNKDFSPIGNNDIAFVGSLDGQNHTISNLYIEDSTNSYVGLFYKIDGTVKDLTLRNVDITGAYSTGALAGTIFPYGYVNNCSIIGGQVTGTEQTGGLVGLMTALEFDDQPHLSNSHSDSLVVNGTNGVGGLVGASIEATIEASTSSATVNGELYVGGLIGTGEGETTRLLTITKCSSTGAVNATTHAGGLVGYLSGYATIDLSYSSSDITATEGYAGGLAGRVMNTKVSNCYSIGAIETLDQAGGFIGYIDNNVYISNCYTASTMDVLGKYCGGFCSEVAGSSCEIISTYFCTETTGFQEAIASNASSEEVTGLSNTEAALEASFGEFDFAGTWTISIDSTIDTLARPYLKWQTSPVQVTLTTSNSSAGSVSGTGYYANNEEITITAAASIGWKFSCWKDDETIISTSSEFTFTSASYATYNYQAVFVTNFTGAGTGSIADPYHITSMTQLEELSNLPTFWGYSFVIDNNIDASSSNSDFGFSPIGTEDIPFNGRLDGQDFSINNLYIDRPSESSIGLFGFTKAATISNVKLNNVTIEGLGNVGTLIGQTFYNEDLTDGLFTNVSNCHVSNATVTAYSIGGGLIGSLYTANVYNSTVSNITLNGGYYVGGLTGEAVSLCEIDGCTVLEGTVNATDGYYVGGFAGRASYAEFNNCKTDVTTSGSQYVGGFVGFGNGYTLIDSCSAAGLSTADGEYPIVGGFIGYQSSSSITKCFATGDVECSDLFGGGFLGYSTGSNASVIDECYATGNVTGRRMIGGFAGSVTSIIRFSYSTGEVDGTINGTVEEHEDIDVQFGGFAGRINASAYVGYCYTFSDVTGYILTSGFSAINLGIIEECYCANEVVGVSYNAGFAGYTEESSSNYIKNCYYDYTISPIDAIAMGDDEVSGLTSEEFALEENMDFSFSGIWQVSTNENFDTYARPYLKNDEDATLFDVKSSHEYAGELRGFGWYKAGQEVTVEVNDIQAGLRFTHWEVDSVKVSSGNPYSFEFIDDATHSITAIFEENNTLSNGDGSETNPYQISTFDDLICMSNVSSIWDKHFILANDIDASDTKSMNGMSGFSPIGVDDSTRFTGSFDGQNHKISNIYISRTADDDGQAFFANVGDSLYTTTIKNFTLDSAIVGGAYGVGTLVGDMINTELDNCNAHGLLIGTGSYVGGLVGRSRDGSTIKNCSFKGAVHSPSSTSETATGGLVGYSKNTVIDYCYVVADSVVTWGESVGGLVGFNQNTEYETQTVSEYGISHSFVITGYVASVGNYLGGLVGSNNGAHINQCYAVSPLVSYSDFGSYKGAIYGDNLNGEITSTVYDRNAYQPSSTLDGTGITAVEFSNEALFTGWDFTNDWVIAIGSDKIERPYFASMDYSTITFKVNGPGLLQVDGKGESFTEITDNILKGYDSRSIKALPSSGFELKYWTVEDRGMWDTENIMTHVPSSLLSDLVIVANFTEPASLSEISSEALTVYPNPVENTIYADGVEASAHVTVITIMGREVYNGLYNEGVDISSLASGVYVLQVNNDDHLIKTHFVKQ